MANSAITLYIYLPRGKFRALAKIHFASFQSLTPCSAGRQRQSSTLPFRLAPRLSRGGYYLVALVLSREEVRASILEIQPINTEYRMRGDVLRVRSRSIHRNDTRDPRPASVPGYSLLIRFHPLRPKKKREREKGEKGERLGGDARSLPSRASQSRRIVSGSPGSDDEGKFPKRFPRNEPNSPRAPLPRRIG